MIVQNKAEKLDDGRNGMTLFQMLKNTKVFDMCTAMPYTTHSMRIRSIRHKGLKRFVEDDDSRGVRPDLVNRVRNILAALISAQDLEGVQGSPGWRIHQLTGDRAGTWSISASGNWRITFDLEGNEITNLDLEDYH